MSEVTRLNLIQRAMQRAALSREAGRMNGVPLHESLRSQNEPSEQKLINGAPFMPRANVELAQTPGGAEPVHLDFAKLRASRIATPENQSSVTYNEFRSLKRKLIPITLDPETGAMTRNVVMVTSALPREGKTFTVMNLAIALAAEANLKVILVDCDVARRSIAEYFQGEHQDGLLELLTGKREHIEQLLHPCAELPGLHVLFAGQRHEAAPELLASRRMADLCISLSRYFQQSIVLFDMPPVLAASEPAAMAAHANHVIMLIAAGQATRHQVEAALEEVSCCPSISLLFNQSPQWERPLSGPSYYYGHVSDESQS